MNSMVMILFMTLSVSWAYGQKNISTNADNVALGGYDVVAYFNAHSATRGNKDHMVKNDGVTYYFGSEENASAFKKDPNKYLPAYGGYCAFAMAMQGAKVPADPRTFKIRDGKLYLFFNDYYEGKPFNTIVLWNSGEKDMIVKADANWKKL